MPKLPAGLVLTEGSHNFLCLLVHGRVVKKRTLLDPLVDENVVRNAQQLFNIQLLINAGDARSSGLVRVLEVLLYAIYENLALIRLMYAGEYLDQR